MKNVPMFEEPMFEEPTNPQVELSPEMVAREAKFARQNVGLPETATDEELKVAVAAREAKFAE